MPAKRIEAKVILSRLPPVIQYLQSGWKPCLILGLMLGLTWVALAVRGFTLGFYGDVVAYQFHYRFDGVIGGMNWLIAEHWQRHLLGALFSAPLHILAPGRYDLWYALALGLHLMLGLVVFLLVDTLQSGQRHWLAFATALFFVFDTLQTPSNIEFATGSHRKAALILAALSLWSYIHFIRSERQQLGWYMFNIATFILAVMAYEQSFFFFVLHPVIAFVEDRRRGAFNLNLRYLRLTLRDSLLHVMVAAIVVYLLLSLFHGGNDNLQLTPSYILGQMADGFALLLSPIEIIERLALAASMSQIWMIALLALAAVLFFGGWIWNAQDETSATPWTPLWMMLFGLLLALLNLFNTAPTVWSFANHPRLLYASSIGSGMIWIGLLAWAVDEAKPYLLLITDRHAEAALALHPRDVNFPHVFALHYGIREFRADAVLYNDDEAQKIQQIQLRDAGIISPLSPQETIGYDRVVVVSYDSRSRRAAILDRLPDDARRRGNFEIHADMPIETNWSLLP